MTVGLPRSVGSERFELLEHVGSGGMAVVVRAWDHHRGDSCAVKLLPASTASEKTRFRFRTEALTMRELVHPHIVRIREVSPEGDLDWFAMDLAAGGSLAELVRRSGVRPVEEALGYTLDALEGLAHAHAHGVVHRDVKPHNMLLARPKAHGGPRSPLLLTDFGIARHLHTPSKNRVTGTGDTLGTLAYMSPEQRLNARSAAPPSDVYGLGGTLYLVLTGRRPFDLAMSVQDPTVYDRIHPAAREIVRRATLPDPADRYATAGEMAQAVRVALAGLPARAS